MITCSAPEGIHLTSIQWSRESNVITAGVARTANSLSLTVSNVQLQDGGDYVCAAVDSFDDMETVTAVLAIDGMYRVYANRMQAKKIISVLTFAQSSDKGCQTLY